MKRSYAIPFIKWEEVRMHKEKVWIRAQMKKVLLIFDEGMRRI